MTITNNYYFRVLAMLVAALAAGLLMLAGITKPAEAAFPGNNGKIVFASEWQDAYSCEPYVACTPTHDYPEVDNPEGDYEIFSINPNGTGLKQLTKNDKQDTNPAVSADGLRIVFERGEYYSSNDEIYVMKADGSGQTRLTNASEDGEAGSPTFSPDGQKIAYTSRGDDASNPEGDSEIYQMIAFPGSVKHNLTNNDAADGSPAYAPDGQKIAFISDRDDQTDSSSSYRNYDVYVMNSDGTNPSRLTTNTSEPWGSNHDPAWSPDGKKIAFTSYRLADYNNNGDQRWDYEIFTMSANGTNQVNVSGDVWVDDYNPTFSPDGKKIAFSSDTYYGVRIYTMNATDGFNRTKVTNSLNSYSPYFQDEQPDWQPIPFPKCTITGTEHDDVIEGTSGNDVICGKGGNDQINGGPGHDTIYGGDSCSSLCAGNDGDDTLVGGEGNDKLDVKDGKGNDKLNGQGGWDKCVVDSLMVPPDSKTECEGTVTTSTI